MPTTNTETLRTIFEALDTDYQAVQDGDGRTRIVLHDEILGWVTKWHKSDELNHTGIPQFSAKPFGCSVAKHDCATFSSAVAYLREYANG